jgi:hypothetical protein
MDWSARVLAGGLLCGLLAGWLAYNIRHALHTGVARSGRGVTYARAVQRFGYWATLIGQTGLTIAAAIAALWLTLRALSAM